MNSNEGYKYIGMINATQNRSVTKSVTKATNTVIKQTGKLAQKHKKPNIHLKLKCYYKKSI